MSVEAISWALKQPIKPSSAKFVLVAIANCADGQDFIAWPSMAYLTEATDQDRKTVLANVARLKEMGFLEDTGERKGSTKQVIVYRLKEPEIGTVKEDQKRNSTENGTVPKTDIKSPVFPHKESQISRERGPKTGHGTVIEPSKNRQGTVNRGPAVTLPDWLPEQVWQDWVAHRKAVKAPLTDRAAELSISKLAKFREQGHDPVAVINQSVLSGKWTDLYAPKTDQAAGRVNGQHFNRQEALEASNRKVAEQWLRSQQNETY
ncbi:MULTISPECIES: helix-turn-helix domain-containing protein [unclassified Achromobacter]|uniref:helix-turn-helix domain-containing protein n=1 Tax=unclassified Achromobacter TaxID=2626865 RepID=UPI000B51BE0D|nr:MULTISPECIES: helix-turn-helix domain-containing protein [unclassified Achromobacter]OWT68071.1 hypothetical protein CEY05_28985 [Achromobacter sp. HZ34]OWT69908.1 hypothetical protein CEY04_27815 [Achromobacter sp. HZ28]